ncbi:MAG: acyl-CoA thioesterase [Polyangiaceae bacterium]
MTEIFAHEIVVAPHDIDILGHASNITFVRWIQDSALAHSASVGLDVDAYKVLGAVFIVVRHEIDYVRPAMLGDVIEARTWVASVMAAKCVRATELLRKADGQVLARGQTTWGFIEIATGRPKRIAQSVKTAFSWDASVITSPSSPPSSPPPSTPA